MIAKIENGQKTVNFETLMFNLSFHNKYKVYQGAHGILRSVYLLMTDLKYACHDINQHQKIRHLGDFPQSDLSFSGCC